VGCVTAPDTPLSLLLADDDPVFLDTTALLLKRDGHICRTAASAADALEVLESFPCDLVLTDIWMPGNENLELVAELADRGGPPVVLLTARPCFDSAQRSIDLGVVGYLVKPLRAEELRLCLQRCRGLIELRRVAVQQEQVTATYLSRLLELRNGTSSEPLDQKVVARLALSNLAGVVAGLEQLNRLSAGSSDEVCRLVDCPRLALAVDRLEDAVRVIEQTKHAFKSKLLGELRERLLRTLESIGRRAPDSS